MLIILQKSVIRILNKETQLTKEKLKQKMEELKHQEKIADAEHEEIISMEEKCRKLTQLLKDHNRGAPISAPAPVINENELDELERDIQNLENQLKSDQYKYEKLHKKMLNDINDATKESDIVRLKLKEKESEVKINKMKINEIRRSMPRKSLLPMAIKEKGIPDMKQKGSTTQYQGSISSARKAFNSTGKYHPLIFRFY